VTAFSPPNGHTPTRTPPYLLPIGLPCSFCLRFASPFPPALHLAVRFSRPNSLLFSSNGFRTFCVSFSSAFFPSYPFIPLGFEGGVRRIDSPVAPCSHRFGLAIFFYFVGELDSFFFLICNFSFCPFLDSSSGRSYFARRLPRSVQLLRAEWRPWDGLLSVASTFCPCIGDSFSHSFGFAQQAESLPFFIAQRSRLPPPKLTRFPSSLLCLNV